MIDVFDRVKSLFSGDRYYNVMNTPENAYVDL